MPRYTDVKSKLRLSLCAAGAALCGVSAALSSGCSDIDPDPISYVSIPVPTFTLNISPSVIALLSALPSGTWTLPTAIPTNLAAALASGIPTAVPSAYGSYTVPPTSPQAAPASFETCATCHGAHGEGAGAAGPEIQHEPSAFVQWIVRTGRNAMPAHNTTSLPDQKLSEIVAYLTAAPRPTSGAALYQDLCANCHGVDSAGKAGRGPSIKSKGASVATRVRQGAAGTNYGSPGYMPAFSTSELTDAEVQAIVGFLK
jgi:mono/diheme cytochrome c family protein